MHLFAGYDMKTIKYIFSLMGMIASLFLPLALFAEPEVGDAEITVDLRMDVNEYLVGEKIRGVVSVFNNARDSVKVGKGGRDKLFLELFLEHGSGVNYRVKRSTGKPFTVDFELAPGQSQSFEVFFERHFAFRKQGRYSGRAVLTHNGARFQGALRTFDVVPGLKVAEALQMFAEQPELKRRFELLHWSRNRFEHLFIRAIDEGWMSVDDPKTGTRREKVDHIWTTADLGTYLSLTKPKLSVNKKGEVSILHRASQDEFVKTLYWSLPEVLEFQKHEALIDPEVAASERVKAMYLESQGVEPVKKPWWKFW